MTAEPRDVEAIRADIALWAVHPFGAYPTHEQHCARERLLADVEPLLDRLAAADRENAELRGQLDAARRWQAKRVVAISQDPTCIKWMHESERMLLEVEAAEAGRDRLRAELERKGESIENRDDLLRDLRAENAELRGEVERQAQNESALVTIIRIVSETYTDAGVLLWLNAKNRHLRSKPDGNHRCTPAEYIAAGHAAEVLEAARRIEGSL